MPRRLLHVVAPGEFVVDFRANRDRWSRLWSHLTWGKAAEVARRVSEPRLQADAPQLGARTVQAWGESDRPDILPFLLAEELTLALRQILPREQADAPLRELAFSLGYRIEVDGGAVTDQSVPVALSRLTGELADVVRAVSEGQGDATAQLAQVDRECAELETQIRIVRQRAGAELSKRAEVERGLREA